MNVIMTHAFELAAKTIADAVLADAITRLAEKYGFSAEEATRFLSVTVIKDPIAVTQLPWCGTVIEDGCQALAFNQGLYTQCPQSREDDTPWCKKCVKNLMDGKPKFGTVADRLACGMMDYKVGAKQVVPYANVMKRKNLSREYVEYSAEYHGLTIHQDQFVMRKKIGRPGKPASSMTAPVFEDAEDADEDEQPREASAPETREQPREASAPAPSAAPSAPAPSVKPREQPREQPHEQTVEPELAEEEPREEGEIDEEEEEEEDEEITMERLQDMNKEELHEACKNNDIEPVTGKKKWTKEQMKTALIEKLNL
jgi:hypothetical protein